MEIEEINEEYGNIYNYILQKKLYDEPKEALALLFQYGDITDMEYCFIYALCSEKSGHIAFDKKDYEAALKNFLKVVKGMPTYCEGHFNLGYYGYYHLKNYDKATEEINYAIGLAKSQIQTANETLARYYNALGTVYKESGNNPGAEMCFEKAQEQTMNIEERIDFLTKKLEKSEGKAVIAKIYKDRAGLYEEKEDYEQAIKDYEKALEYEPRKYNRSSICNALGFLYSENDFEKAENIYKKGIEFDTENYLNYRGLADLYLESGRQEEYEKYHQMAVETERKIDKELEKQEG